MCQRKLGCTCRIPLTYASVCENWPRITSYSAEKGRLTRFRRIGFVKSQKYFASQETAESRYCQHPLVMCVSSPGCVAVRLKRPACRVRCLRPEPDAKGAAPC